MKFYQEWKGFIWEFNSFGEFLKAVIGRILGAIIGIIILIGLFLFLLGFLLSLSSQYYDSYETHTLTLVLQVQQGVHLKSIKIGVCIKIVSENDMLAILIAQCRELGFNSVVIYTSSSYQNLKSKGKINAYGKYATMSEDEDCHLFVYDKQRKLEALCQILELDV